MTYRLDRYEFKFLISTAQRDAIIGEFPGHIVPDGNSGEDGGYRIYSLYFDTPQRDCYWEKLRGLRSRRKLRVRLYESTLATATGACFVEIKHKHEGRGVKRRLRVPLDAAMRITSGEEPGVELDTGEERILNEVRHLVGEKDLKPVCCLRYDRRAYMDIAEDSDLRITFDENICYRMDDLPSLHEGAFDQQLLEEDEHIMEVKVTGAVPVWLTGILYAHKCTPGSRSKYCDAIAAGIAVRSKAA
ncbi:MAG: polyphosphate polymerase domain-containing protein [Chthoniobacterales bacterium]